MDFLFPCDGQRNQDVVVCVSYLATGAISRLKVGASLDEKAKVLLSRLGTMWSPASADESADKLAAGDEQDGDNENDVTEMYSRKRQLD